MSPKLASTGNSSETQQLNFIFTRISLTLIGDIKIPLDETIPNRRAF